MPRADFVAMASDPKVLGDPRLRTQHLVGGAARWARGATEDEVTGSHQMRVAHQRHADDDEMAEVVAARGHAHGRATVWYRRVDGVWKFAGIEVDIRWTEYECEGIFEEGEEKFRG